MAGYITLPMFEISERPFAVRLADWLERVAVVPPDAGATVTLLRAELARALRSHAELAELGGALAHLATRVHVGQRLELVPVGPEPGGNVLAWFAGYHAPGFECSAHRAQSLAGSLLGLSGFLKAKPWIGSPNPALHYSCPPESSNK